jgi:hypothetical protein
MSETPKVSMNDLITIDGVEKTFKEHCRDRKIIPAVAQRRVNVQGRDPVEAITTPVDRQKAQRENSNKSPWRKMRL